jgi:ATF/CREB family transcription factor
MNALSGVLNPNGQNNFGYNAAAQAGGHDSSYQTNGLFLLSQAHQELEKRELSAQQQADNVPTNGAPPPPTTNGAPKRGSKRKSYMEEPAAPEPTPALPSKGPAKRTRSTTTTHGRRKTSPRTSEGDEDEEDFEDDDDMHDLVNNSGKKGGQKKPETEEEKRRNFLERNRQGTSVLIDRPHSAIFLILPPSGPQVPAAQKGLASIIASQGRIPPD